ncbi:MAG: HD-GYP domain-containing protein [Clostridia bacterium]
MINGPRNTKNYKASNKFYPLSKKLEISIAEALPGMVIAETLTNLYGGVIVYSDTIVNKRLIDKLSCLGFSKILIYDMNTTEIEVNQNYFSSSYNEGKLLVKDMIKDVGDGKPVDLKKLRAVSTLLLDQIDNNRAVIETIGQVRQSNEYTYTHCLNVALLSSMLGRWLGFEEIKVRLLTYTGLLHDIGKAKISNTILDKPGPLTAAEFEIMKTHPVLGYKLIEKVPSINPNVALGVLMHHEREDGSGYPFGAKGNQIAEFGKIIALTDIYDAMTSERSYKPRQSPFEVFEMFENHSFGVLDLKYSRVLLTNIANYYVGDLVRLNTNQIGEIIYINPHHISKPLIRIDSTYVDLYFESQIKIIELIKEYG